MRRGAKWETVKRTFKLYGGCLGVAARRRGTRTCVLARERLSSTSGLARCRCKELFCPRRVKYGSSGSLHIQNGA